MDERRYRGGMFVPGFRPPGSHMEASQFQYQNTFGFHNILYPPTPSNGNVHFPSGYSSQLPSMQIFQRLMVFYYTVLNAELHSRYDRDSVVHDVLLL